MGAAASVSEPADIPLRDRRAVLNGAKPSLEAIAELIRTGRARRILVAAGAGISVSAGIPDFRTPGTGLYDNLKQYGLPTPESVFTLEYFREHPEPFYKLAKDLLPGKYRPTLTHFFFALLEKKRLLQRIFTQNIDGLERLAGVSPQLLVESHGSFADAHCIECGARHSVKRWYKELESSIVPRCGRQLSVEPPPIPPDESFIQSLCEELKVVTDQRADAWATSDWKQITNLGLREKKLQDAINAAKTQIEEAPAKLAEWEAGPKFVTCSGLVKPAIVFFGEGLPKRFSYLAARDGKQADLLIVLGTSLQVMPFAGILGKVPALCPRLLINREAVGLHDQPDPPMFFGNIGMRFCDPHNYRDIHVAADCDDGVRELCKLLGWTSELETLEAEYTSSVDTRFCGDGFLDLVASGTESDQPSTVRGTETLGKRLFDAAVSLVKSTSVVGLSKVDFDMVACHLSATCEGIEFLVSFADVNSKDEVACISQEQFTEALDVAREALGSHEFHAIATRQLWALQCANPIKSTRETILAQFCAVSEDSDCKLDRPQFTKLLQTLDSACSTDEVDKVMESVDQDGDGRIDVIEFVNWLFADCGKHERTMLPRRNDAEHPKASPAANTIERRVPDAAASKSSASLRRRPSPQANAANASGATGGRRISSPARAKGRASPRAASPLKS